MDGWGERGGKGRGFNGYCFGGGCSGVIDEVRLLGFLGGGRFFHGSWVALFEIERGGDGMKFRVELMGRDEFGRVGFWVWVLGWDGVLSGRCCLG